jgi:hypothetical protein
MPTRKYSFVPMYSVFVVEKITFCLGGGGGKEKRRVKYHLRKLKVKFEVWRAQGLLTYSIGITLSMTGEYEPIQEN